MEIPSSFKLGNKSWRVEQRAQFAWDGTCYYQLRHIVVRVRQSKRSMAKTFWHEFVHAALDDMGYRSLSRNETFVNELAVRINELVYTAKFDK